MAQLGKLINQLRRVQYEEMKAIMSKNPGMTKEEAYRRANREYIYQPVRTSGWNHDNSVQDVSIFLERDFVDGCPAFLLHTESYID